MSLLHKGTDQKWLILVLEAKFYKMLDQQKYCQKVSTDSVQILFIKYRLVPCCAGIQAERNFDIKVAVTLFLKWNKKMLNSDVKIFVMCKFLNICV